MTNINEDIIVYVNCILKGKVTIGSNEFQDAVKDILMSSSYSNKKLLYLFDEDYYLSQRGSRIQKNTTPILDFFENGVKLRLSPHPLVDMRYFDAQLKKNMKRYSNISSVPNISLNPLCHIFRDLSGGMDPNSLFDSIYYRKYVSNLPEQYLNSIGVDGIDNEIPIIHYLNNWYQLLKNNHLKISCYFDPYFYDLSALRQANSIVDPLSHYFRNLPQDRHDCNPKFHGGYYRINNKLTSHDALSHFIQHGAEFGLKPNPYAYEELGIYETTVPQNVISEILLNYIKIG